MQNQRQVAFRDHVWQTDLPEDSFVVKIARLLHNTPAKSPTKTRNFRKRRTSPSETCLLVKQNLRARPKELWGAFMRRSNVCYSSLWMMYCFSGLARDTRDTEKQKILYVEQLRALKLGTRNVKGQLKLRYCSIWMISLSRKEMIKNGVIGIGKF